MAREIDGVPATAGDYVRRLVRDHAEAERLSDLLEEVHDRIMVGTASLLHLWEPGETKYVRGDRGTTGLTLITRTANDDLSVVSVRLVFPDEIKFPSALSLPPDQDVLPPYFVEVGFTKPDDDPLDRAVRGGLDALARAVERELATIDSEAS